MATESAAGLTAAVARLAMTSRTESQSNLPEHDENGIRDGIKTYTRGNARPAKQKRPLKGWYWKYGENIHDTDNKDYRWKCEPCWESEKPEDQKFTHFAV